jgi:hypothetical protein
VVNLSAYFVVKNSYSGQLGFLLAIFSSKNVRKGIAFNVIVRIESL